MAQPYHKNPRKISKKQLAQLKEWLLELGDLSGIVHDLNSDEIIGGNQRTRALGLDLENCETEIVETKPAPDAQGTVAVGFLLYAGNKYNYRQVRWTPEQCEKANIVANKAGGEWDWHLLGENFEWDNLLEWGWSEKELGNLMKEEKTQKEKPVAQIAEDLVKKWGVQPGQVWLLGEAAIFGIQDVALLAAYIEQWFQWNPKQLPKTVLENKPSDREKLLTTLSMFWDFVDQAEKQALVVEVKPHYEENLIDQAASLMNDEEYNVLVQEEI